MPKRIQRKRTKGWRMPEGAVYVGRGTIFGNPFTIDNAAEFHSMMGAPANGETPRQTAVRWYREWLAGASLDVQARPPAADKIAALRGKDLACFCPLGAECHADVLLELANASEPAERAAEARAR